jgi:3D (Asp-Asp-Asp) domain-containing protein
MIFFIGILNFLFYSRPQVLEVNVTAYHIKGKTASGIMTTKIDEPFVAISRDLFAKYPLGSYIYLSNCKWEGMYKVMDKMGKRKVKTIDVYSPKIKSGQVKCSCAAVK